MTIVKTRIRQKLFKNLDRQPRWRSAHWFSTGLCLL